MQTDAKKNSRREFLKTTSKIGAVATIGGLAVTACSDNATEQSNVVTGKSNKEEILYQSDTKHWREYYLVAK